MSKALKAAIEANDPAAAAKAVKTVKDLGRRLPGALPPAMYAVQRGADAVLDVLLDAGAPLKPVDGYAGNSPFALAAEHGHTHVMRKLHERGLVTAEQLDHVVVTAITDAREPVLRLALETFKPPVTPQMMHLATGPTAADVFLRLLAAHGGDVEAPWDTTDRAQRPLHMAAGGGRPNAVRTLIELGADPNGRDARGRTPLMALVRNVGGMQAHNEMMERMRQYAAEGKAKPVDHIGTSDPHETMRVLLELGADATVVDDGGNDALAHYETESARSADGPDPHIVEILRRAGGTGGGPTASLFNAIRAHDLDGVRAAIAAGADLNAISPHGATPLTAATYKGSVELVGTLIRAGADVDKPGHHDTPLISAAVGGNLPVVQWLVEAGADVNQLEPDHGGQSLRRNALLAAEWNRKYDVVDYLKTVGGTRPKPADFTPLKVGVESWNDFDELLVRADVATTAAALARVIKGSAQLDAYGKTFKPGPAAFVVIRPKGMNWSNVFRVAPPNRRGGDVEALAPFYTQLATAAGAPVLHVGYSDTSDAAATHRFEPDGTTSTDDGWSRDLLEEILDEMGDDAPDHMKARLGELADVDEDQADSTTRLVRLAEAEQFCVAALGFDVEPGRPIDVEVAGYPAEAFDGGAWVSN